MRARRRRPRAGSALDAETVDALVTRIDALRTAVGRLEAELAEMRRGGDATVTE